jgi:hypothetical protein
VKMSLKLIERVKGLNVVASLNWESARIRRCRSGKHQLANGYWSWEIDFPTSPAHYVIGSTSTMKQCLQSKGLDVDISGGFVSVEPMEFN